MNNQKRFLDDDTEDEEEADSMESDIEGLEEDFDLPNEKAWGKKKNAYYSTDYVDPDYASASQKDLAEAEIEEEEARSIQKRLAEQLDDVDFGLEFVESKKEIDSKVAKDAEEVVKTDLTKLSKRQKQIIVQKESPEFMALVNDFKDRMTEAKDVLTPFLNLTKNSKLSSCSAVSFVKIKYHLSLNYCINISFYLMLKAKRLPVNSHPVIKRLAQYRQLLNQLESGQGELMKEIQEILKAKTEGKPLYNVADGSKLGIVKSPKLNSIAMGKAKRKEVKENQFIVTSLSDPESDNEEFMDDVEDPKDDEVESADNVKDTLENITIENDGKRAITYQIAKNKGLTPYRKKELRNPRVKHRNKYRKAKIRRKGAIREVRKELNRYAGEISGIKASVKKSIKLK